MENEKQPMDPYKTMCVVYHGEGKNRKEVGRIPATAKNAEAYITELARYYKGVSVEYVEDRNAGLLGLLHS